MFDVLRKYVKAQLDSVTKKQNFFLTAGSNAKYPYTTFELVELGTDEIDRHLFELTVDAWDKSTSPKNVISMIDALDKHFKHHADSTEHFVIRIFHGSAKQFVDDEDKDIIRLQRRYDVIVITKGE